MMFFSEKFPFSRPKILMTFFLVIDQVFLIFPFFSQILRIFTVLNVIYDPFFTRKTAISKKNSLTTPFFYSVRTFARIRQHYFSKYWGVGGRMHGPSPHLKFWGNIPPRSSPCSGVASVEWASPKNCCATPLLVRYI